MNDLSAWPALVLTAGLGTRLRPLSLVRAKAALPVGDEVLVRHVLRWLHAAGVRRVVLNLHHLPETITPHIGDGGDLGLEVRYSWEPVVLGSAGGPRRALPLLDAERFLIVNGDTLTDVALQEVVETHLASGAAVTMTVTAGDPRYGGVMAGPDGIVRGFAPPGFVPALPGSASAAGERFHFVGVQAVEGRVFEALRDDEPSETVRGIYPQMAAGQPGSIRTYRTAQPFYDIGTPADYLATAHAFGRADQHGNLLGRDVSIHPSAQVSGCVLWDRVTIGANARLDGCIVADDVTIDGDARHQDRVIVTLDGRTVVSPIR